MAEYFRIDHLIEREEICSSQKGYLNYDTWTRIWTGVSDVQVEKDLRPTGKKFKVFRKDN